MRRSMLTAAVILLATGMVLSDSIAGTALVALGLGTLIVAIVEGRRA